MKPKISLRCSGAAQHAAGTSSLEEENAKLKARVAELEAQRGQLKRQATAEHEELWTTQAQLIQAEKLAAIGQLATGVAHEVKNPLAIIQQGIAYLASLPPANEMAVSVLRKMDDAVVRAGSVIRGLLDFAAPRALDLADEPLNAIVEGALGFVKHELLKSNVTAVTQFGDRLPLVRADKQKITQAFVNLLLNAVQAMPNGGSLTIRTSTRSLQAYGPVVGRRKTDRFRLGETVVVAEIEDNGPGIPEQALPKIFEPFFTTKPPGQGTGLGLTVVKQILDLHSGTIDIRNRVEGGVGVTLMFKVAKGGGGDVQTPDPHRG